VTREQIQNLIRRLNEIENTRSAHTVDEIVADLSALMAADIEGWANGKHFPSRSAADELDRALFQLVDDYYRDIEHIVIDPPFVSFGWRMRSVKHNLEGPGCTIMEVDEAGLMLRFWMYFDPAPLVKIGLM
jgi:hypothetical protein